MKIKTTVLSLLLLTSCSKEGTPSEALVELIEHCDGKNTLVARLSFWGNTITHTCEWEGSIGKEESL